MTALPEGWGLVLDPSVRSYRGGTVLVGGHPGRVMHLTSEGARALARLVAAGTADDATRALAGRLVGAGMAQPRPGPGPSGRGPSVAVVVPARDRADALRRCLDSLADGPPVVVVDDGSSDPGAVARACRSAGARLVRRELNGGPGAARNDGLAASRSELVAFVDSDCTVPAGWLEGLLPYFADPSVAAVAPRVVPGPAGRPGRGRAAVRFTRAHSPLDLGPAEGPVGPDRLVRYVPTAALVVRRSALGTPVGGAFDPGLPVGEDVDLVWRLVEAGQSVRYVPAVTVTHAEPDRWTALWVRRFRYGTSAAPLARRHPGRLAPVELRPGPTATACALLGGRPRTAAACAAVTAATLARRVRPLGVPVAPALRWSAAGAGWTVVGLGRAATMLYGPVLWALARRGRRGMVAAAVLVLAPPLVEWVRRRPDLDLPRWVAASVADDVAYGAGVWAGCLRHRTAGPLLPALRPTAG